MPPSGRTATHGTVPVEWTEGASAVNAVATATRVAETNRGHFLLGVLASISAAAVALLTITYTKNGVAKTVEHYIHNADVVLFGMPIECDPNTLVQASLAAAGAGNTGKVAIWGYSLSFRSS